VAAAEFDVGHLNEVGGDGLLDGMNAGHAPGTWCSITVFAS